MHDSIKKDLEINELDLIFFNESDGQLRCCSCILVSVCVRCLNYFERTAHLFFDFPFARAIWLWIEDKFRIQLDFSSPIAPINCCSLSPIENLLLAAVLHVFTPSGSTEMRLNLIVLMSLCTRPLQRLNQQFLSALLYVRCVFGPTALALLFWEI